MAIRCHPETHYDAMGNAASERRTCVQPQSGRTVTLLTRRGYDSWGRADSVVYPDGETVRYRYGRDGRLRRMEGTKAGSGTARIRFLVQRESKQIGYMESWSVNNISKHMDSKGNTYYTGSVNDSDITVRCNAQKAGGSTVPDRRWVSDEYIK